MDSSITRALANEHQNVYGKAAATEEQQLQFLNKMVAGLENPKELEMAMTFSALKGDYTFSASLKFTGDIKKYDNVDFRKAQVDKFDQLLGVFYVHVPIRMTVVAMEQGGEGPVLACIAP